MRRSCSTASTSCAVWECSQKAWMVMRGTRRAAEAISGAGPAAGAGCSGVRKLITETPWKTGSVEHEADRAAEAPTHVAIGADAVAPFDGTEENGFRVAGHGRIIGRHRHGIGWAGTDQIRRH